MKDYDSLSEDEKREYDQLVTLKIALGDVEGILEFLAWAQTTADYLSELEAVKGTPRGQIRLKTYANLANELIQFVTETIKTGEPDYNKIN